MRVGEAVSDMAVGVDLPVAARLRQLMAERDDLLGGDHRIVPAVERDHLGLDLLGRQAGRVEQAVEANRRGEVLASPGKVERALPAETIAGDDDLAFGNLAQPPRKIEHMFHAPAECSTIGLQPVQFAEHRVALGTAELLAEQVGDKRIVAEFDQLAPEPDLEVGHPHHRWDQNHRRPCLAITSADEDAFQVLSLEIMRDGSVLAHHISLASSASLATVFMLRAVPASATGICSRERPIPLSPYAT